MRSLSSRGDRIRGPDEDSEVLERVKRLETRVTSFMVWNGFDPHRNLSKSFANYATPTVVDGAIHAAAPNVTVGDLMMTALKHDMVGEVDVFVAGRRVMTMNVEDL